MYILESWYNRCILANITEQAVLGLVNARVFGQEFPTIANADAAKKVSAPYCKTL